MLRTVIKTGFNQSETMSQLPDLLAKLKISDDEYIERLMGDCKRRDSEVIEKIKSSNNFTLDEWKKKLQAISFSDLLLQQRQKMSHEALEIFAKNRREKNEINIRRISKNPKYGKEHVEKLRAAFEVNAVADIEAERKRLEEQDAKAISRVSDTRILDRQAQLYLKTQEETVERLRKTMEESERMLRETVEKSDEEFYKNVVDELTKPTEGPSVSFSVPRFQMFVALRDAKRAEDIGKWHEQRDKEFLRIRTHVDVDNAKLLTAI